jgi:hypothetical protein
VRIDCNMPPDAEPYQFRLRDKVEKVRGYRWPGVVVARFLTLDGTARYAVECIVPEIRGALHIFSANDLKRRRTRDEPQA